MSEPAEPAKDAPVDGGTVLARRQVRTAGSRGLFAGALAGIGCGLLETVLVGSGAEQFLPTASQRALLLVHLCALEGFAGALLGVAASLLLALLRSSGRVAQLGHRLRRGGPAVAAGAMAALLAFCVAALAVGQLTLYAQLHFHRRALIAQLVGALSPLLVLAAAGIAFPLAHGLRLAIAKLPLARTPRGTGLLVGGLLACILATVAIANRETLQVLDLRPLALGLCFPLLLALALWRLPFDLRPLPRRALAAGLLLLLGLVLVRTGAVPAVRKATAQRAVFGGALTRFALGFVDLDRDGFAPILGGGDCNDFDASVHPGAIDTPGDGIDQNCSGADAQREVSSPAPFVAVPPSVPAGPNILLITIDTLRADHMSLYGYGRTTTPNLDRLGRSSVVFESGYAHSPSTRYSMPVILTGRYASQLAWDSACPFTGGCATRWPPPLSESNLLISELLKQHGYYTAALLNYRFFEPSAGYRQGFDLYDNGRARLHQGPSDPATHGSSSREQAEVAIEFLAQAPAKWFLWVHFYDPHYYYEDHPETSFGPSEIDRYDSEIAFTDRQIGRLLAQLSERQLDPKTIVIVTADHGEGFGEHGIEHHGYHLYGAQTRVPLLIRVPGIAPRRVQEPVGHVDLLPTLLNLIRGDPVPTLLGRTAIDLMLGSNTPRTVFQEVMYEGPVTRKALVTRDFKLIWNMVPDNTYELYHLASDPQESRDRWGDAELESDQQSLVQVLGAWAERQSLPPPRTSTSPLSHP